MNKKRKKNAQRVLLIICIVVFCVSCSWLVKYYWQTNRSESDFKGLQVSDSHNLQALYQKNSDIVGWLEIEGTKINYPVMQTPEDPEYYIRKDFEKEYSIAGSLFMDGSSEIGVSKNYIIYGHNIKSGTMFHQLLEYEDEAWYKEHKSFVFDSLADGECEYEVLAVLKTEIYDASSTKFKYYQFASITSEGRFDEYVGGLQANSLYETGVTASWGDQLVTLSTCAYHTENGRFVVVGVKK